MASDTSIDITDPCAHVSQARIHAVTRPARGCEDCMKIGAQWVHLRQCLTCGHVGCCDSSPNKHATAHFKSTQHPVMASLQPGERWAWCYVDNADLKVPPQYTRYLPR